MQVHFQIDQLPRFKDTAITIGTFDGVHNGHLAILQQLVIKAKEHQGESVVITFHPHPRRILHNADAPALLTSLDERIERFQKLNIDHLVIVPFDPVFSTMSAKEYIEKFLVECFHPKVIVIGHDHRFGKGREGNYSLLMGMGEKYQYTVVEIPEKLLHDARVSSTGIRHALLEGKVSLANELLGYPYSIYGTVIEGDKLGRKLGFPTANLSLADNDKLIPASGVYAVQVEHNAKGNIRIFKGMMNIGYRPTVNGKERRIEVHIFDFDEDIYFEKLKVSLLSYTRKEMKFSGLDALKQQLENDREHISNLLKATDLS